MLTVIEMWFNRSVSAVISFYNHYIAYIIKNTSIYNGKRVASIEKR
ncbi:hypothetical protein ATE84_2909 [Aquimarina sp. MAR_2010_214]|nr:hypothetical protein ATE84_2909 [Aquimarina sp. MAR_2010_214]